MIFHPTPASQLVRRQLGSSSRRGIFVTQSNHNQFMAESNSIIELDPCYNLPDGAARPGWALLECWPMCQVSSTLYFRLQ